MNDATWRTAHEGAVEQDRIVMAPPDHRPQADGDSRPLSAVDEALEQREATVMRCACDQETLEELVVRHGDAYEVTT